MSKENETKKKKIKLKFKFKVLFFIISLIIYSFFIGTKGLFINDYNIKSEKIKNTNQELKILHFSDIHYKKNTQNNIKNLRKKINKTNSDIVVFSGDLIKKNYIISDIEINNLKKELKKIKSEYGKYYINGDEDKNKSEEILNESGFININNTSNLIYKDIKNPIIISGENKIKEICQNKDNDKLIKILLIHNPNDFEKYKNLSIDLVFSGHTNNGKIAIPKIKEFFINGNYINNYQKVHNTKLFISNGISNKGLNFRLFNHPSFNIYRIKKNN